MLGVKLQAFERGWRETVREPYRYRFCRQTNLARDLVLIVLLGLLNFAVAAHFDLFEEFGQFSRGHEEWQLDEFVFAAICVGVGILLFARDRVLELREAGKEALKLATEDELTGLPNRRQFIGHLSDPKLTLTPSERIAVFVIDLDGFKPINDLYGHRLGDEVLRATAHRLKKIVGDQGLVARIGGDEFGLVLPMAVYDEARVMARRIISELPEPIQLAALSLSVGVSVGIAYSDKPIGSDVLEDQDGSDANTIMRQADMALYKAKKEEGSCYQFFCPEMDDQLRQQAELESEIGPAIKSDQIVPYYQPLVDLRTGAVTGCEVLARWKHPTRGLILPSTFIPLAGGTGNISALTYSLLRQAIRDAQTWPESLTISVNLSPLMMANSWLVSEILQILTELAFPAHRLTLEITETTLIDRPEAAKSVLTSLRNLGVRVALDDFGAGYSGLSYLRQFDIDTVKLDRSFIGTMLVDPRSLSLVEAIISFCHSLRLSVTAEGIEDLPVMNRLTQLGCDSGQGFLFSKPKPNSGFLRYLNSSITAMRKAG